MKDWRGNDSGVLFVGLGCWGGVLGEELDRRERRTEGQIEKCEE